MMKKVLVKRKVDAKNVNTAFQVDGGNLELVGVIIKSIEDNTDLYYTKDGVKEIIVKVITEKDNPKYLRSSADDSSKNNLDYLPLV
jgi:hypothetical protein